MTAVLRPIAVGDTVICQTDMRCQPGTPAVVRSIEWQNSGATTEAVWVNVETQTSPPEELAIRHGAGWSMPGHVKWWRWRDANGGD